LDCPACYNLVQDAVNEHRQKLNQFLNVLQAISENPTVIEDVEFEAKLKALNEKVNIVLEDAKSSTGGSETSLAQRMETMQESLKDVEHNLDDMIDSYDSSDSNIKDTTNNLEHAQQLIIQANNELKVSFPFIIRNNINL
jgi:coxsackievirus/adenovirus receptor